MWWTAKGATKKEPTVAVGTMDQGDNGFPASPRHPGPSPNAADSLAPGPPGPWPSWPLALLAPGRCRGLVPDGDGLVNLALAIDGVTVSRIEPLPRIGGSRLPLALPAAVEPHCHLDKAFTWSQAPNPSGTMAGAMEANLREHKRRSAAVVAERMDRALETAWRQGYRALRSHLDLGGRAGSQATWEAMAHTWGAWSDRLQLQAVALAPLEFWSTTAGVRLARQLARSGGGLGGALAHHNTQGSPWRERLAGKPQRLDQQGPDLTHLLLEPFHFFLHLVNALVHPVFASAHLVFQLASETTESTDEQPHASHSASHQGTRLQPVGQDLRRQGEQRSRGGSASRPRHLCPLNRPGTGVMEDHFHQRRRNPHRLRRGGAQLFHNPWPCGLQRR